MGAGGWFKMIINLKKAKDGRTKQVHSALRRSSNGPKWRYLTTSKESTTLKPSQYAGVLTMGIEDIAAMRIQTAFRAFLARKALRRLKGAVKLQTLIEDNSVRKQISATLNHIHSWSRIQAEVKARRICMVVDERMRLKKHENQLKLEAKLHEIEVEWCGGADTMEEIISKIYQREEAAIKRERTMAYAFSHQWRPNSTKYFSQAYFDLGKESWAWSWKERWVALQPWETRSVIASQVQIRQGKSKSKVAKTPNQQPTARILVSVEPVSSNGKETTKAIRTP